MAAARGRPVGRRTGTTLWRGDEVRWCGGRLRAMGGGARGVGDGRLRRGRARWRRVARWSSSGVGEDGAVLEGEEGDREGGAAVTEQGAGPGGSDLDLDRGGTVEGEKWDEWGGVGAVSGG